MAQSQSASADGRTVHDRDDDRPLPSGIETATEETRAGTLVWQRIFQDGEFGRYEVEQKLLGFGEDVDRDEMAAVLRERGLSHGAARKLPVYRV